MLFQPWLVVVFSVDDKNGFYFNVKSSLCDLNFYPF